MGDKFIRVKVIGFPRQDSGLDDSPQDVTGDREFRVTMRHTRRRRMSGQRSSGECEAPASGDLFRSEKLQKLHRKKAQADS